MMPKSLLDPLPEVFVSTKALSTSVSRAVRAGRLRKIGSRLYTKNLGEAPEAIVRRHLWQLVARYVPGALIADRTAIENAPAIDGSIFVIADRKRAAALPGISIRPRKGAPPLDSDRPFIGNLFLSSTARAFLDNMTPSRRRKGEVPRTLTRDEMERRLERMLRQGGAASLNRLRDDARAIAPRIGRTAEYRALDKLIGALLGTQSDRLITPEGRARRAGAPFDPDRLRLFADLHRELRAWPPTVRPAAQASNLGTATLTFFEAYFSNFIEGTEFEVSEAADIVFKGIIPRERPADAHDVLGTWRIVSDAQQMGRMPATAHELLDLLRSRHAAVIGARPEMRPGQFKIAANRAGTTMFVAPELVQGTLAQAFDLYRSLDTAFARAVLMMSAVAEVHPFADGNGRIARIMMNAELVAAGETRILIPTVYRNNYLAALKALSQTGRAEPLIRVLDFAQAWTAAVPWGPLSETRRVLDRCNAFADPTEAEDAGIRLRLPRADE